jgi:hypothetical protein
MPVHRPSYRTEEQTLGSFGSAVVKNLLPALEHLPFGSWVPGLLQCKKQLLTGTQNPTNDEAVGTGLHLSSAGIRGGNASIEHSDDSGLKQLLIFPYSWK